MNRNGRYSWSDLRVCPSCGMDSGVRKVSITNPEKFFVVCESCGYRTRPHASQIAATKAWNGRKDI